MSTVRRADVLWRWVLDGVLIQPPDGDLITLEATGNALWALLDRPRTVDDLADALAATFAADPVRVGADIEPVVAELVERGVLVAD